MKTYIDFCSTMQAELTAKLKLASQLKRLWGTHVVDGIEVYNSQFTIWPGTETENVKKVLKLFNIPIRDIQDQSKDGITRLYLKFDPNKMDTTSYSKEALATMLETSIPFDVEREFTLTYTDRNDPSKFIGWGKDQIQAFVEANINSVTTTGFTRTQDLDDENIDNIIGSYIIAEAGVDFQKTLVDAAVIATPDTEVIEGFRERAVKYISSIVLKYKYKRIGYLDDSSPIVVDMYDDMVNAAVDSDTDIRASKVRSLLARRETGLTNTLWYDGMIRTESSRLLKKHDYANLVFGSLGTGYDQKKSKGWLKILAIIIIIVVTVITWNPGAGLAAGAAVTATSTLTAIAVTAAAVTLALTVYSMILVKHGEAGSAQYVGRWIKVSGFVATVAGVMAAISSLTQQALKAATERSLQNMAASAGTEVVASSAEVAVANAGVSSVEVTVGDLVKAGTDMAMKSVESSTSGVLNSLSTASKVVNPLMEWREKNKMEELTSMSDEYKKQQALLVEEYDKNMHIGVEDIKVSTKPLVLDNLQYEVDYLYEPTRFNIQRGSFARSGLNVIS